MVGVMLLSELLVWIENQPNEWEKWEFWPTHNWAWDVWITRADGRPLQPSTCDIAKLELHRLARTQRRFIVPATGERWTHKRINEL